MRIFTRTNKDGVPAVRRGKTVPEGDINLAWAKTPQFTPKKSIAIVDTSRLAEDSELEILNKRKLYFANGLGILEDANGNQIIDDKHPVIADTFVIDEDFSVYPGSEYTDNDILPFLHVSRYFHIDHAGLTLGTSPLTYRSSEIKVTNKDGQDYKDDDGKRMYRVQITPAYQGINAEDKGAYRIHVYMHDETIEDLYLSYHKVELDGSGAFRDEETNYKELLNPQPYYAYTPEEAEVVDVYNRRKRIYSSKPITLKEQILGQAVSSLDGYKVYVPKKAIGDPRIFQQFKWRLTCEFTKEWDEPSEPIVIPPAATPSPPATVDLYGDGSDGDVTISGAVTLSSAKQYRNLTIAAGGSLNTNGHLVQVQLRLTGNSPTSVIHANGANGANGTSLDSVADATVAGGAGGSSMPTGGLGGAGGASAWASGALSLGSGSGGQGSTALGSGSRGGNGLQATGSGFNTPTTIYPHGQGGVGALATFTDEPTSHRDIYNWSGTVAGGGGAGGGAGGLAPFLGHPAASLLGGGGGGQGGGTLRILARNIIGSGSFQAKGGNGGKGISVPTYSQSGDGGGGGGGWVMVGTESAVLDAWTYSAEGGVGASIFFPKIGNGGTDGRSVIKFGSSEPTSITPGVTPPLSKIVNVGVITTNQATRSFTPYTFLNLELSPFNRDNLVFQNPMRSSHGTNDKSMAGYWYVNIDDVRNAYAWGPSSSNAPVDPGGPAVDLNMFDVLLWCPDSPSFNFGPYIAKIYNYISNGGTVFIDTNNHMAPQNFPSIYTSNPTDVTTGKVTYYLSGDSSIVNIAGDIVKLNNIFDVPGSWPMSAADVANLCFAQLSVQNRLRTAIYCHHVTSPLQPEDTLVVDAASQPLVIRRQVNGRGNLIFSTMGISESVNAIVTGSTLNFLIDSLPNRSWQAEHQTPDPPSGLGSNTGTWAFYDGYLSIPYIYYGVKDYVDGANKFMYNVIVNARRAVPIVVPPTTEPGPPIHHVASWSSATPWETSWVIDGNVLFEKERQQNHFVLSPTDASSQTPVWQRVLSSKAAKELIEGSLTKEMRDTVAGTSRVYGMEVTNTRVLTPTITETTIPAVWTTASSPRFDVPVELGAYVMRAEARNDRNVAPEDRLPAQPQDRPRMWPEMLPKQIAATTGQTSHSAYPPKSYSGQIRGVYTDTVTTTNPPPPYVPPTSTGTTESFTWTATGTATRVLIGSPAPPTPTPTPQEVDISWVGQGWGGYTQEPLHAMPFPLMTQPAGIKTWQERNYMSSNWGPGSLNWPFIGHTGSYGLGSSGEVVMFIQQCLNRFKYFGLFDPLQDYLTLDGNFGNKTLWAVTMFQNTFAVRFNDGRVDAETFAIIGANIMRIYDVIAPGISTTVGYDRYTHWPKQYILKQQLSDYNDTTLFVKRSNENGGPTVIWDLFAVKFAQSWDMHGVTIVPYLYGSTNTLMVRSIHVLDTPDWPNTLNNYDSNAGQMTNLPHRPTSGSTLYIPFGPYRGDTIIIGVGQDGGSGFGTSRVIGIQDIRVKTYANVAGPTPTGVHPSPGLAGGSTSIVTVTDTGTYTVTSGTDYTRLANTHDTVNYNYLNPTWTSVSTDNPYVTGTIRSDGLMRFTNSHIITTGGSGGGSPTTSVSTSSNITLGPLLPTEGAAYYALNASTGQKTSSAPELGWISKNDGIKLLCNASDKPWGFPVLPSVTAGSTTARNWTTFTLNTYNLHPTVKMQFYDKSQHQWVPLVGGQAQITLQDWINRGPDNVYIGVECSYVEDVIDPPPPDPVFTVYESAPLPFQWAMPVYGVYQRVGSRITLEPLPEKLGAYDIWPITIRTGNFHKPITIRTVQEGPLTGWVRDYQGQVVNAYYGVPEVKSGGWSEIYGPPNGDVYGESPLIRAGGSVVQVRQPPIHMQYMPSPYQSFADPMRPIFTLYKRATTADAWVAIGFNEISDYNVSTGEIFLNAPLSEDPDLLKVDYTTTRRMYQFKSYIDSNNVSTMLNLNPYMGASTQFRDAPLYVYIVPEFCQDNLHHTIAASITTTAVRFATNNHIFDPLRPEYDPLARLLGIVYLSTALDINELTMLDTRRRGGGAREKANLDEIARLVNEASSYWDIGFSGGTAYQKGGYAIIRLPHELQNDFSEQQIIEVIDRNITGGVRYEIQDLSGNEWTHS